MSPLFTAQAKQRAAALGVSDRVTFLHSDAAGYVAERQYDGGLYRRRGLPAASREPWALLARSPAGGVTYRGTWWRKVPPQKARACGVSAVADLLPLQRWSPLCELVMTSLRWCWLTARVGPL